MKIVTNPGSSMPPLLAQEYGLVYTSVFTSVDGVTHDNRTLDVRRMDELVRNAKVHPYALGTSAAEFVKLFKDLIADGSELLVVTGPRKIIGTYDSAVAASRTLTAMTSTPVRISIVDSGSVDIGSGLVTIFCGASAKAGRSREAIAQAALGVATKTTCDFIPQTLDYLVAGGRASFLKAMAANLLQKVPIISMVDGELKSTGTVSKNESHVTALADLVVKKVGAKRAVWAAVAHGGDPKRSSELLQLLRDRLDVRFGFERELTPGYYLNSGPGTLCVSVVPVDSFPWPLEIGQAGGV